MPDGFSISSATRPLARALWNYAEENGHPCALIDNQTFVIGANSAFWRLASRARPPSGEPLLSLCEATDGKSAMGGGGVEGRSHSCTAVHDWSHDNASFEPRVFTCEYPDGKRFMAVIFRVDEHGFFLYRAPLDSGVIAAIHYVNGLLRIVERFRLEEFEPSC